MYISSVLAGDYPQLVITRSLGQYLSLTGALSQELDDVHQDGEFQFIS
jgi:hypothetical protein